MAGDASAARYAYLASETAGKWAERILVEQHEDMELQTVAAVVLDLRSEVAILRERIKEAENLAFNLGGDLLHALEAQMDEERGQGDDHDLQPLGYIARGWRRDEDRIKLATCTEGREVSEWLTQDVDRFLRPPMTESEVTE